MELKLVDNYYNNVLKYQIFNIVRNEDRIFMIIKNVTISLSLIVVVALLCKGLDVSPAYA